MNVDATTVHRAQGGERKIVLFDPVDGASPFLRGVPGRRLINVASSRAMTHLLVAVTETDR
jgi:superfamily I DNA and/or RNA helicase